MRKSMKVISILFSVLMGFSFAQEDTAALEKKTWDIYKADMPKDTVGATKALKRINKLYEMFKEIKTEYAPSAEDKARGYTLFEYSYMDDIYPNTVPEKESIKNTLHCYAAKGEKEIVVLGVYPLGDIDRLRVDAGDLVSAGGTTISAKSNIEVGYVKYDFETEAPGAWYCKGKYVINANETFAKKETPRLFYVTVAVPLDAAPGKYKGKLSVSGKTKNSEMELEVEVYDFAFEPFSDEYYFSAFTYTAANIDPKEMERYILNLKKHGMNLIHGGAGSILQFKNGAANFVPGDMEQNALLMKKHGFKKWIIEMTGLPNAFVDNLKCNYYDETFNKAYVDFLKQIKDKADKGGWPEIQIMYDEPREMDTDNPRPLARTYWDMENILKLHNEAGLPALPTYMGDEGGARFENKAKQALYWQQGSKNKYVMTHGWQPSEKLMKETVANGNTLYLYNCGYGRYQFGLLTAQLKAKGNVQFWYAGGNVFNTHAQFPKSYAAILPADGSEHIPVIRWLQSEEGVDDFRYIYTLEKAIEKAKDKKLPDVVAAANYLNSVKAFSFAKSTADGRDADTVGGEALKKYGKENMNKMRETLAKHISAVLKVSK